MNIKGMDRLIFSKAFYKINDFEKVVEFFLNLEKDSIFSCHLLDKENQKLSGSFVRAYPKGHWNPLSQRPGAMQVMGDADLEEGELKISTMSKGNLSYARKLIEDSLKDKVIFEKEEFNDPLKRE